MAKIFIVPSTSAKASCIETTLSYYIYSSLQKKPEENIFIVSYRHGSIIDLIKQHDLQEKDCEFFFCIPVPANTATGTHFSTADGFFPGLKDSYFTGTQEELDNKNISVLFIRPSNLKITIQKCSITNHAHISSFTPQRSNETVQIPDSEILRYLFDFTPLSPYFSLHSFLQQKIETLTITEFKEQALPLNNEPSFKRAFLVGFIVGLIAICLTIAVVSVVAAACPAVGISLSSLAHIISGSLAKSLTTACAIPFIYGIFAIFVEGVDKKIHGEEEATLTNPQI